MSKKSTTWRDELRSEMAEQGESFDDVEACTLSPEQLDAEFDDGFGGTQGEPFTVWTRNRVYFPVCYDGAEWVGSVARNPDGKPTQHVGGG